MLEFVEDVGMALIDPSTLIATVRVEKRGLGRALATVLIFSLGVSMGLAVPISLLLSRVLPMSLGLWVYAIIAVCGVLGGTLLWILDSLIMHGLSIVFGGHGSFSDTMTALGYACAATWPIALFGSLSTLTGWLAGLALLVIGIVIEIVWRLYSMSLALAETHGYRAAKGLLVVLLARAIEVLIIMIPALIASALWV